MKSKEILFFFGRNPWLADIGIRLYSETETDRRQADENNQQAVGPEKPWTIFQNKWLPVKATPISQLSKEAAAPSFSSPFSLENLWLKFAKDWRLSQLLNW